MLLGLDRGCVDDGIRKRGVIVGRLGAFPASYANLPALPVIALNDGLARIGVARRPGQVRCTTMRPLVSVGLSALVDWALVVFHCRLVRLRENVGLAWVDLAFDAADDPVVGVGAHVAL